MTQEEQIQFILDIGSRATKEVVDEIRAGKPVEDWLSVIGQRRMLSNRLRDRLQQYDS